MGLGGLGHYQGLGSRVIALNDAESDGKELTGLIYCFLGIM